MIQHKDGILNLRRERSDKFMIADKFTKEQKSGLIFIFILIILLVFALVLMSLSLLNENLIAFLSFAASVILFFIVYMYINYERTAYRGYLRYKKRRQREKELAEQKGTEELKKKEKEIEAKRKKEGAIERRKQRKEEQRRKEESVELNKKSLNDYIAYLIRRGMKINKIKKTLIGKGWSKEFVNKYCSRYFKIYKKELKTFKKKLKKAGPEEKVDAQIEAINKKLGKLR